MVVALLAPLSVGYGTPLPYGRVGMRSRALVMEDESYLFNNGIPLTNLDGVGQGGEYINAPAVRKPLSEYVGASEEFNLGAYMKGERNFEPWDPMDFSKLSKVSKNNPDVAWLREAELKHCRVAMLAFVGIMMPSWHHFPAAPFVEAAASGWPNALAKIQDSSPSIVGQGLATCLFIEAGMQTKRGEGAAVNWWDGLWYGERAPADGFSKSVVAGDFGWDPLKLLPEDPEEAKLMQLRELKNGRLAMLAVMGIFVQYLQTGTGPNV